MPYIKDEDKLSTRMNGPGTAGELNYAMARLVDVYLATSTYNYQAFNDVVGALENLKFEIQRRFLSVYEDRKRMENGEVFTIADKPV